MDIFLARQPIFNRNQEVVAYELLYREGETNAFTGNVAADTATSILLINAHLNMGLDKLVGPHQAFVNFHKELILNDVPLLLDKKKVVIEILEDIIPDQKFLNKIRQLKQTGYTIALDDVVEDYPYPEIMALSEIIKVEFLGVSKAQIQRIFYRWKPLGKTLLAEKVETREDFEWAKGLGFDLFQGYFFAKPSLVKSKGIKENASKYIQILTELNAEEPDYGHLTALVESDVSMTYKLLKLVNANFTKTSRIKSIRHGLSILGVHALRKWIALAMAQAMSSKETHELILTSMIRSHLLEEIVLNSSIRKHHHEITLIGIISIIDVLLEKPMTEILEDLPLTEEAKGTLLGEDTPFTPAYRLCLDYEHGDFSKLSQYAKLISYNEANLSRDYINAVKWADVNYAILNDPT